MTNSSIARTDEEASALIPRGMNRSSKPKTSQVYEKADGESSSAVGSGNNNENNADVRSTILNRSSDLKSDEKMKASEGKASIPSQVFNLMKTILGSGVLGLPAGIAHAFAENELAAWAALGLIMGFCVLSAYSFSTIGELCRKTRGRTYRQVWSSVVGESTSWIPALSCLFYTSGCVLCYSMVLADTVPAVWEAFLGSSISRLRALLSVTFTTLLPLCLLKDVNRLTPVSILGIIATVYTALAMIYRYVYVTDAHHQHSSAGHQQTQTNNLTGNWRALISPNAAVLMSMLSLAFMAHFNAPFFYWELQNNTMSRFNAVVVWAYLGGFLITATIALAGFLTYGTASQGIILNNYSAQDSVMTLSRFAFSVSVITTYPLTLVGVRDGVLDLANIPVAERERLFVPLTALLLALITCLAAVLQDIGFVLTLIGATLGTAIIYLFPSIMAVLVFRKQLNGLRRVCAAGMLGIIGLALTVTGTKQALSMP